MPLDPSLSLQAQPVQIQPLDLTKTMLTVAQLRNALAEADLRGLQTQQLGAKLKDYQAFGAPGGLGDQLQALRTQGAMPAAVPPLWRNAPALPASQADMVAPGAGGEVYPQLSPTRAMDQLSPGVQAPPGTTYGRAPETLQAPAMQPVQAQVLPPGAAEPQARPTPAQPPGQGLPQGADLSAQLEKQMQLYQDWTIKHPFAADLVKPLVELDKSLLDQRKGALELQSKGLDILSQSFAALNDLPPEQRPQAYAQRRQLLIDRGIPGAAQIPPQFDQATVDNLAMTARTKKERMEQEIAQYDAMTRRHEALTKQAQLGEGEWKQTAKGEWFFAAKNPGAQTGAFGGTAPGTGPGGVSAPAVNPLTGQPYTSMEAEKFKDEQQGTITAQHQAASQSFRESSLAMGIIRQSATPTDPKMGQVSDEPLVDNYFKLMMPSNLRNAPESQIREMARRGNLGEQASRLWERVFGTGGAPLEQADRDRILAHAETLYKQQGDDYDKNVRGPALARLKALPGGPTVPADQLIPDARTTAPGPPTAARLSPADHAQLIEQTGTRLGMSSETIALYKAITFAGERSNGDPLAKNVGAGGVVAWGLGQITADTAKPYGYSEADLKTPMGNTEAGLTIVNALMQKYPGRPDLVAAAYNAGPKPVENAGNAVPNYPKTQEYVQRTLAHLKNQQQAQATPAAPTARSTPQADAAWRQARITALEAERQRLVAAGGR